MTRDAASHAAVAQPRGIVGEPDVTYVYDAFVEVSPPVVLVSHIPDTDLVGGGWLACRWAGAFRCIAGGKADAADWPNHGGNVIDAGVGSDFELKCKMTFKVGNYVGFIINAAGTGISDFTGWQIAYFAASDTWRLSDGYYGGGGAGTLDSHVQAMDETGATSYEIKIVKEGSNITVYIDDVQIMTATNNKYDANTCHGLNAWSDDGGTWDEFYITSLPTPARVAVSPDRTEYGLWFNDEFVDSFPTVLTNHAPDVDFYGGGWNEYNHSGTADPWNVINYNAGALRRDTGASLCYYYAYADVKQADCVIRSRIQDHQGINPMWDGYIMRWVDFENHFFLQFNAESNWIKLLRMQAAAATELDSLTITVDPSDYFDVVIALNGNDFTVDVDRNSGVATGQLTATDAFQNTATEHGVFNRPMNGYNPWSFMHFEIKDS